MDAEKTSEAISENKASEETKSEEVKVEVQVLTPPDLISLEELRQKHVHDALNGKRLGYRFHLLVRKVPVLIHRNGLGQTLAFLKAHGRYDHYKVLYRLLSSWTCERLGTKEKDLLTLLIRNDSKLLKRCTQEVCSYLATLRLVARQNAENEENDESVATEETNVEASSSEEASSESSSNEVTAE